MRRELALAALAGILALAGCGRSDSEASATSTPGRGLGWSLGQVTRTMPVFSKSQPSREGRPDGTTAYVWRLDSGLNPASVGDDAVVITLLGPDDDLSRVQCDLLLPAGTPDKSVIKDRLIVGSAFLAKISGLSFEEMTKWVGSGAHPRPKVIGDNVITCTLGQSRITYAIDPK